jgi:hypothetical protein
VLSLRLAKAVTAVPIDVAQLASKLDLRPPISVRAIITAQGTRTRRPRVMVLRYRWQKPKPGGGFTKERRGGGAAGKPVNREAEIIAAQWPDTFLHEVLAAHNGWSLRDYWYRASFGLVDLEFVVQPWRVLPKDQSSEEAKDRHLVIEMCKDQAKLDGVQLGGIDHVIAFLHPGQNNAGASGGDALFDQYPFSLEFFQHEMGHMLGFSHAFGPHGDYVYEDPWCVMGRSRTREHPVAAPSGSRGVQIDKPQDFWHEGPRLSTAALVRYRDATEFSSTSGVRQLDVVHGPQTFELVASSEGGLHSPTIAIIDSELFQISIEYRMPTGDDAGIRPSEKVRPAVVVHSTGRRETLRWHGEKGPIWIEAEISAEQKAEAWIDHGWNEAPHNLHVEVLDAHGSRAVVRVSRADPS